LVANTEGNGKVVRKYKTSHIRTYLTAKHLAKWSLPRKIPKDSRILVYYFSFF